MPEFSRMPRYDVRNDGIGPYAIFYCDFCSREFRSQPDVGGAVAQDLGRQVAGGLLRKVPLFGNVVADNVVGEDPRYTYKLTPAQLEKAWLAGTSPIQRMPHLFQRLSAYLILIPRPDFARKTVHARLKSLNLEVNKPELL